MSHIMMTNVINYMETETKVLTGIGYTLLQIMFHYFLN